MISLFKFAVVAVATITYMASGFPTTTEAPAPWTHPCSDSPAVVPDFDFPGDDSPATIVSRLVSKTRHARDSAYILKDIATDVLVNRIGLLAVLDNTTYKNFPILDESDLSSMDVLQAYLGHFDHLSHVAAFLEQLKIDEPTLDTDIAFVGSWTSRLLCEQSIGISNMGATITDHVTRDVLDPDFLSFDSDRVSRYSRIYVVAKRSHDLFSALTNYYTTLYNHLSGQTS